MGMLNTGKMLMKARKAQSQMKSTTAAGKSKSGKVAILVNGLNDLEEIIFDFGEEIKEKLGEGFWVELEQEIKEAYKAAKKELEAQLAASMDLDSIREMLGS